jgi:hypothetical protein
MGPFLPALYLFFIPVLGYFPARALCRGAGSLSAEWWIPIAFITGLTLQAILFLVSIVVAGYVFPLACAAVALAIGGAILAWELRTPDSAWPEFTGFEFVRPGLDGGANRFHALMVGTIGLLAIIVYTNALSYPFTSYDGRAIWSFKARVLFHHNTIHTEAFTSPYVSHYHYDYPLLMPFAKYVIYLLSGEIAERSARILFSTVFLIQLLFLYGATRRLTNPLIAILATLLYCATPFRDDWSERDGGALNSGAVDIPLSLFALIAVVACHRWWKDRSPWLLRVAAVAIAGALMTKKEGVVILAIVGGVNLLQAGVGPVMERLRGARAIVLTGAGALLLASPWLYLSTYLPNFYDEKYSTMLNAGTLEILPGRVQLIGWFMWEELFNYQKWNYYWAVYFGAVLLAIPSWITTRSFYFDSIILSWIAIYLFVYLVSPLNLVFHLNTSISRLASHFMPIVLLRLACFVVEHVPLSPEKAA